MNFISPCNQQEPPAPTPTAAPKPSANLAQSPSATVSPDPVSAPAEPTMSDKCIFRRGQYEIEYIKPKPGMGKSVSCVDAEQYINSVNLSYDSKLLINKKPIGSLIVNRALETCSVKLYYGDFMTVGLMSGDRLMCDDLISGFAVASSKRR